MDIFNSQCQQSEQDADRFLLIPGKHHGQRKIIYAALKRICQGEGNLNGRIGVVALADVQQAGQPGYCAKIQLVEAIFAAGQGEDD